MNILKTEKILQFWEKNLSTLTGVWRSSNVGQADRSGYLRDKQPERDKEFSRNTVGTTVRFGSRARKNYKFRRASWGKWGGGGGGGPEGPANR